MPGKDNKFAGPLVYMLEYDDVTCKNNLQDSFACRRFSVMKHNSLGFLQNEEPIPKTIKEP